MPECKNITSHQTCAASPVLPLVSARVFRSIELRHCRRNPPTQERSNSAQRKDAITPMGLRAASEMSARNASSIDPHAAAGARRWKIGDLIVKESILGHLNGLLVRTPFDGILRGIVRDGTDVPAGVEPWRSIRADQTPNGRGWMNAGGRSPKPRSTPSVFTPRKRKVQAFRRAADLRNCLYDRPPNLGFHDSGSQYRPSAKLGRLAGRAFAELIKRANEP